MIAKESSSRTAQTIVESMTSMCFEDLDTVKRSAMIESQDSCPIASESSTGSRGRNSVLLWHIDPSEWDSRKNGADIDEGVENVRYRYGL